jgi:hypothetical protein
MMRMTTLTEDEQRDFAFLIARAKKLGWIESTDELTACVKDGAVVVHDSAPDDEQEGSYSHDDRWIYKFMSDLAQGRWRKRAFRI